MAMFASVSTASAVTVNNGDFETGNTSGWPVSGTGLLLYAASCYGPWFGGTYYLWLGGHESTNSAISQSVGGLTIRTQYAVTFIVVS